MQEAPDVRSCRLLFPVHETATEPRSEGFRCRRARSGGGPGDREASVIYRPAEMRWLIPAAAVIALAAACGGGEAPTAATRTVATEAAAAEEAPDELTDLDIVMLLASAREEPWYATLIDTVDLAVELRLNGLDISLDVVENVSTADGERVIRELAAGGKYEMIIGHGAYSDAVDAVNDDYPDIAFVFSGPGNEPVGGNAYWIDVSVHEPAYLAGIIAGAMTETGRISAVAAFPVPNVNAPLNAWIAGARSVNPDVEHTITYIESWFDPAKAKESAAAQIAAGSDMVYAESSGVFEAVSEAEGVYTFGHFADQLGFVPQVLTSSAAVWDPAFRTVLDAWWDHRAEGRPYDAPMERIVYSMADGGSDIGEISDQAPVEVRIAVEEAREDIIAGRLRVELDEGPVE